MRKLCVKLRNANIYPLEVQISKTHFIQTCTPPSSGICKIFGGRIKDIFNQSVNQSLMSKCTGTYFGVAK